MLKMLLCTALLICTTLLGNYYASRLSQRRQVLSDYINLLMLVENRIRYTRSPLYEVFGDNFASYPFSESEPFSQQFHTMADRYRQILTKEDLRILYDYGDGIGSADEESGRDLTHMTVALLKAHLEHAEQEITKKSRMYRALGFSAGMTLALLVI